MIEAKHFLECPNNIIKKKDVKKKLSFICNLKLLYIKIILQDFLICFFTLIIIVFSFFKHSFLSKLPQLETHKFGTMANNYIVANKHSLSIT